MVKRILSFFNRDISSLHEAAFILGLSSLASQMLALFRDRLFASEFGASKVLDIYYASFRIPDLLYVFVASLVAGSVLIPFVAEHFVKKDLEKLHEFLNSILTFFIIILFLLSLLAFFVIPYLTDILVPGFSEEETNLFVSTTRILLLSPLLLGLSNLFGSVTQALKRFFIYAFTPILYNVGIIFGFLYLYKPWGLTGLAVGVLLGAFFHFAIQVPTVLRSGIFPFITFSPKISYLKHVVLVALPRTITLSAHHIIIIVFTSLASIMAVGSISVFNFAYNLQSVPLAIIGVSYSVAAFPTLSRLFSGGDTKAFVHYIITAARHIIFWSMPVLSLFIVLRAQIVRVLFGAGNFSWENTRLVAASLALFAFSVFAQGLILLFVRGYYAAGNTKKPLFISIYTSLFSLFSVFFFLYLFSKDKLFAHFFETLFRVSELSGTNVLMLPFAFSLGAVLNMSLLWLSFKKDFKTHYVSIRKNIFQILAGSLLMGFVSYLLLQFFDDIFDINTFFGIFMQGFLSGMIGLIAGILSLKILKNRELSEIESVLRRKLFRTKPILPTPEDLS